MKKPKWQRECSKVFRQMRMDYPQLRKCGLVFKQEQFDKILDLRGELGMLAMITHQQNSRLAFGMGVLYNGNNKPLICIKLGVDWDDTLCHEVAHHLLDEQQHPPKHTNLTKKLYKKYFKE